MLLKPSQDVPAQMMTMAGASGVMMQVLLAAGDGAPNFALRKFTVAPGGHTPKHAHPYEHEVYVLAGTGMALGADRQQEIRAGDAVLVPANEEHQFQNTGSGPLIFLCVVPGSVHPAAAVDCGR